MRRITILMVAVALVAMALPSVAGDDCVTCKGDQCRVGPTVKIVDAQPLKTAINGVGIVAWKSAKGVVVVGKRVYNPVVRTTGVARRAVKRAARKAKSRRRRGCCG